MRAVAALLAMLLLAGCAGGKEEPEAAVETRQEYLGGGSVTLTEDKWGGSIWVEVGANATRLQMELVYTAVGSVNPRVRGLPECEWGIRAVHTETRSEVVDCAATVPGRHEVRVEHEGGDLTMAVRVLGHVPVAG